MAGQVKRAYLDTVMTTTINTVTALLFSSGLIFYSFEAEASNTASLDVSAESSTSDTFQTVSVRKDGERSEENDVSLAGEKTAGRMAPSRLNADDDDFVDKDGDGIRDGKEHRFRRSSGESKDDAGRHSGKQRRQRAQRGRGNGA